MKPDLTQRQLRALLTAQWRAYVNGGFRFSRRGSWGLATVIVAGAASVLWGRSRAVLGGLGPVQLLSLSLIIGVVQGFNLANRLVGTDGLCPPHLPLLPRPGFYALLLGQAPQAVRDAAVLAVIYTAGGDVTRWAHLPLNLIALVLAGLIGRAAGMGSWIVIAAHWGARIERVYFLSLVFYLLFLSFVGWAVVTVGPLAANAVFSVLAAAGLVSAFCSPALLPRASTTLQRGVGALTVHPVTRWTIPALPVQFGALVVKDLVQSWRNPISGVRALVLVIGLGLVVPLVGRGPWPMAVSITVAIHAVWFIAVVEWIVSLFQMDKGRLQLLFLAPLSQPRYMGGKLLSAALAPAVVMSVAAAVIGAGLHLPPEAVALAAVWQLVTVAGAGAIIAAFLAAAQDPGLTPPELGFYEEALLEQAAADPVGIAGVLVGLAYLVTADMMWLRYLAEPSGWHLAGLAVWGTGPPVAALIIAGMRLRQIWRRPLPTTR